MKPSILFDTEMNDIVFENRNKSYGAYALRSEYELNMTKGMVSGFLFFLCCVSSPLIYNYFNAGNASDEEVMTTHKEINLETFIAEKVVIPPVSLPKETPPPVQNQIKFVSPTVVIDEDVVEHTEVPTIEMLESNTIGNTTIIDGSLSDVPEIIDAPDEAYGTASTIPEPEVYNSFAVQQQPEFPDGMAAMYKFLQKNLKYPQLAIETSLSGTVHVQFVVSKNGDILDAKVLRGIGGGLDQEALRVINLMPAWRPGKHNGKPVAVIFTLPIKFQLLK